MEHLKLLNWSIRAALGDGVALRKAAGLLNERAIGLPRGGRWHAPTVFKAAHRRGLR